MAKLQVFQVVCRLRWMGLMSWLPRRVPTLFCASALEMRLRCNTLKMLPLRTSTLSSAVWRQDMLRPELHHSISLHREDCMSITQLRLSSLRCTQTGRHQQENRCWQLGLLCSRPCRELSTSFRSLQLWSPLLSVSRRSSLLIPKQIVAPPPHLQVRARLAQPHPQRNPQAAARARRRPRLPQHPLEAVRAPRHPQLHPLVKKMRIVRRSSPSQAASPIAILIRLT
mmetsp:Transcript_29262/g.68097  ORF Transcript_29262/g.68097 Transcript_29262/m.68097 type:complete len:226 (-) Transcript_29262:3510-4187(-)